MSYLPAKPFNPSVSSVPILGSSSGNPKEFRDPKSVASIGSKIQAMADQANADTLYDAPAPKREGFRGSTYMPWITSSEACRREGFTVYNAFPARDVITAIIIAAGIALIACSFGKRRA